MRQILTNYFCPCSSECGCSQLSVCKARHVFVGRWSFYKSFCLYLPRAWVSVYKNIDFRLRFEACIGWERTLINSVEMCQFGYMSYSLNVPLHRVPTRQGEKCSFCLNQLQMSQLWRWQVHRTFCWLLGFLFSCITLSFAQNSSQQSKVLYIVLLQFCPCVVWHLVRTLGSVSV